MAGLDEAFGQLFQQQQQQQQQCRPPSAEGPPAGKSGGNETARTKRAAATKPKTWNFSDDNLSEPGSSDILDHVDQLVKGIGGSTDAKPSMPLSLISLGQLERNKGNGRIASVPKPKVTSAQAFVFDSDHDTNYELLAKPSPNLPAAKTEDAVNLDSFLSDEASPLKAVAKARPTTDTISLPLITAKKAPPVVAVVKKGGRPLGTKNGLKTKATSEAPKKSAGQEKAKALSPAADEYAS
ncbi:DNA topoisomerase 2 [Paramyrothecium foliicola]|nr:DNA topoisomerase 2 [Paramyrothecium foliicola]